MNGKSRPIGGSQTPAKKSTAIVRPTTAEKLLRHALGTGDVGLARLLSYLITGEIPS